MEEIMSNELNNNKKKHCRNLKHSNHYYYLSTLIGYKTIKFIFSLSCIIHWLNSY